MKSAIKYLEEIIFLLGKDKNKFPWIVLLSIISSVFDIVGLSFIGPYLSAVLNKDNQLFIFIDGLLRNFQIILTKAEILIAVSIFFLFIFFLKTFLTIQIRRIIIKFSWKRHTFLQVRLIKSYQNLPYVDYIKRNRADYIQTIHTLSSIYSHSVMEVFLEMISNLIILFAIVMFFAFSNLQLMMYILISIGLILFIFDKLLNRNVRFYGEKASFGAEDLIKGINEGMTGLKEIRILGKQSYFTRKVESASHLFTDNKIKSNIINSIPQYLLEFIILALLLISVIVLTLGKKDMSVLIPTIGVAGLAFLRVKPLVGFISNGFSRLRYGRYATKKIYEDLISYNIQNTKTVNDPKTDKSYSQFNGLELKNVSFSYPGSQKKVLNDISLKINRNESIGFIGPSGSGKTTLLDIILGLLTPQEGKIFYNNNNIENDLYVIQKKIAYLPQEIFITDNSLISNVALGIERKNIDIKKVEESINKARLTDLLSDLPDGINTMLGDRGIRLSGGQRQRVALARAFYHERDILIMDESTSSLDEETESKIVEEIKLLKGNRTLIVIAHRLSTVQHCDKIFKLVDGIIVQKGNFEEVVINNKR